MVSSPLFDMRWTHNECYMSAYIVTWVHHLYMSCQCYYKTNFIHNARHLATMWQCISKYNSDHASKCIH